MSRALVTLRNDADRARAHDWIDRAPTSTRVEFKGPARTLPQNDRMWAMLTDVATQKLFNGRRYKPDQLKIMFMAACGHEVEALPSLDGETFIPWGYSSSALSTQEMSDLIEFIFAWGAENGVFWSDPSIRPELRQIEQTKQIAPTLLIEHHPENVE